MRQRFNPWVRKIPWKRARLPTVVFLPEKSHGQRSLVGYNPKGCKESDMMEPLSTQHACTWGWDLLLSVLVGELVKTQGSRIH